MTTTESLFKNRKLNPARIVTYGFTEKKDGYVYSAELINGQLEMTVSVTKTGKVSAKITDIVTKEEYIIHQVSDLYGGFVGKVREEYDRILNDIAGKCFETDVFKSEYSRQVIQYIRDKYHDELEFLWTKFPNNAIFRRQDSKKWYAALLILQKQKLGLKEKGIVEIIDLRIKPENVDNLIDNKRFFPGYHMNKKHWFTICLDGSVPIEEIFKYIDISYTLAVK